ncbi:MAG TPA: class I SAM-dependent methyltransferase [Micromonosporaceae bacterium]|nr:class I SAM-dependent methyltransferase [Micromonosporaceae bacterium]
MEATEIRKLTLLEDTHWWYRERRALIARALRDLPAPVGRPGRALDIGAAGGGNTRVLVSHGWHATALEYSADGVAVGRERGLSVLRADARMLPVAPGALDLVVAFDILEHVDDDFAVAGEIERVLRPGGTALISVPSDMRLWSEHDVAVGHVRRYSRDTLTTLIEKAGLVIDELWSWNVLLRPIAAWRRGRSSGSDLSQLPAVVNAGLSAIVAVERYLPVRGLPGVSLMLRAHRPT